MEDCYVYILKCCDDTYYTGWTNQLAKRIDAHNRGEGAKYTRAKKPVHLVYYERCCDKSAAMKREYQIKQLTRKAKVELISAFDQANSLLLK